MDLRNSDDDTLKPKGMARKTEAKLYRILLRFNKNIWVILRIFGVCVRS